MKIVVLIKRVMDCSRPVTIDEIEGIVRLEGSRVPMMNNPADLSALELAKTLKLKVTKGSITAISLGGEEAKDALITALANGADTAIHIRTNEDDLEDPFMTAVCLAEVIKIHNPDLVLCGTKAFDTDSAQLGGLISQFTGLPHISSAMRLDLSADNGFVVVQRKLEKGRKLVLKCKLPALIAVEPSIAEPKYTSLFRQIKVNRKLIEEISIDSIRVKREQPSLSKIIRVARTKPRAKKTAFSAATLSPLARMRQMTGQSNAERGKLVEGDRDALAEEIFNYLKEKKIILGAE